MTEEMLTSISGVTSAKSEEELLHGMKDAARRMGCDHLQFSFELRLPNLAPVRHVTSVHRDPYKLLDRQPANVACEADMAPSATGAGIAEESLHFALGHGFSVPVHEHGAMASELTISRNQPFERDAERSRVFAAGSVLAHCLHVASGRIMLPGMLASRRPALSPREKQCFQLVAHGKSNWDIGQLLNISEETAAFHVKNVLKKFNVSSRIQAVAIGVALGMIT